MTKTKKDKETAVTADTRAEDTRAKVYEQPVVVNMVGKTVAAPQVLLNDRDKMYMATAKKTSGTMTFVYSLVCPRTNGTYYEMIPNTEVATFTDPQPADIYYRTVNQIMEYQQRSAGFRAIREGEFMAEYIKLFNERTK